jgi:hypothetical protein
MIKGRKWRITAVVVASIALGLCVTWLAIRPPLIDVHGRRVEARVKGSGTPTVVFELGASGGNLTYWRVQQSRGRWLCSTFHMLTVRMSCLLHHLRWPRVADARQWAAR